MYEFHVDAKNKVVTTPAFMSESPVHEIFDGIGAMVTNLLKLAKKWLFLTAHLKHLEMRNYGMWSHVWRSCYTRKWRVHTCKFPRSINWLWRRNDTNKEHEANGGLMWKATLHIASVCFLKLLQIMHEYFMRRPIQHLQSLVMRKVNHESFWGK